MDKLACFKFVVLRDDIEDAVKVAAAEDYINSIQNDQKKIAAFQEMEELFKEASWWRTLAQKSPEWLLKALRGKGAALGKWGKTFAQNNAGKTLGGLGSRVQGLGQRMAHFGGHGLGARAASVGKAAAGAGAAGKAAAGAGKLSRFKPWLIGGGVGTAIGGGGVLYGNMKQNDAYKQGYGAATQQVGPMLAATMGPRGAIGMNNRMA